MVARIMSLGSFDGDPDIDCDECQMPLILPDKYKFTLAELLIAMTDHKCKGTS